VLIDDKAIMTDQDRKYVYVLGPEDKASAGHRAGSVQDGLRVVQSGLDANDKVVVAVSRRSSHRTPSQTHLLR